MKNPWEEDDDSAGTALSSGVNPWEEDYGDEAETAATVSPEIDQPITIEDDSPPILSQLRHAAGGVPQAGFDILDMPSNMAKLNVAAADYLFGEEGFIPEIGELASKVPSLIPFNVVGAVARGRKPSELPGLKQAKEVLAKETVTREEAPVADAIRTGLEWGAGGLVRAGQRLAGKAVSLLPDIVMGTAAGTGSAIGGETGELVGGIAGLLLALRTGDFSKISAKEQNALEAILRNSEDPQQALAKLEKKLADGEIGTLADLTDDALIYDIQEAVGKTDASAGRKLAERAVEREQQAIDQVSATVGGTRIEDAVGAAERETARKLGRVDTAARSARAKAEVADTAAREPSVAFQDATEKLAQREGQIAERLTAATVSKARPAAVSRDFAGRVDALDTMLRENLTTPAWDAFKAGPRVKPGPIKQRVNEYLDGLVPEELALLRSKYGTELRMLDEWVDTGVKPQSIQTVLSEMKNATRKAAQSPGGSGPAETFLSRVIDEVDAGLREGSDLYDAARNATLERIRRTGGETVKGVVRTAEPEKVIRKLGLSNEDGAVMLRRLNDMEDPKAKKIVGEALRVKARQEGVDEKFLEKYADMLDGFPDMRTQMEAVARQNQRALAAADNAKQVTKEQEKFRKTLDKTLKDRKRKLNDQAARLSKATENGLLGSFGTSPRATVKKLLSAKDKAPQLTRLYQALRRQGGGEGFKGAVRDELLSRTTKQTPKGPVVNPGAYDEYSKIRDSLVDSGILTGKEADEIGVAIARQLNSVKARANAVRDGLNNPASELNRLLSSGAAAATMQFMPGGQSLILAGAVRRSFLHMLRKKVSSGEIKAIENFLLNPQKFLNAAKDAENVNIAVDRIITAVMASSQAVANSNQEAPE